jgi:protein involved in polysaccharide export with SLBB domain
MMMDMSQARLTLTPPPSSPSPRGRGGRNAVLALAVLTCALAGGCTAVTNPNGDGIPVRLLPQEIVGPIKTNYQTVPLSMLRQPQPDVYRLAAGDVLGVFVDGFLGEKTVVTPVQMPPLIQLRDQNRFAPAAGYPIPVQEDGTIALPAVAKLSVKGKTVGEAQELVRDQYLKAGLIKKESDRTLVTLLYQRQQQVLVFRQEATSFYVGADGPFPTSKRNTGQVVDLPAYQNDVLTALARSGGLPDADAHNEIIIYRDSFRGVPNKLDAMKQFDKAQAKNLRELGVMADETIRIPLRLPTGAPLPFGKEDVILKNGDVIFLEARDEEVFYTAGLLPPGKHQLPRDHDLDVLDAIMMSRGPLYNGAFGGSNLAGDLVKSGLGNPSPSLLVVVRRLPNRGQLHIAVDLRAAMRYPQERLVIRPGDVLILQEKPAEAFARYMNQTFFNFNILWTAFRATNAAGIVDIATPDRLAGRLGTFSTLP